MLKIGAEFQHFSVTGVISAEVHNAFITVNSNLIQINGRSFSFGLWILPLFVPRKSLNLAA